MTRLFLPEERTAQVARQFPKRAESAAKSEPSAQLFLPEPLEQPFPSERAKLAARLAREFPLKKSGLVYPQFPKTKSEREFLSEQVVRRFPKMRAAESEPSAREFPPKRSGLVCPQFPTMKTKSAAKLAWSGWPCPPERSARAVRRFPKMRGAELGRSGRGFPPGRRLRERGRTGLFCPRFAVRPKAATAWKNRCRKA